MAIDDQSKNPLDAEADTSKYSVCRISRSHAATTIYQIQSPT